MFRSKGPETELFVFPEASKAVVECADNMQAVPRRKTRGKTIRKRET